MSALLELREKLRRFYSRNDVLLIPLFKFIIAFIAFNEINSLLGYMSRIDNVIIVMILALMCSFLPKNFIVLISAVFIFFHMYSLSLECGVVMLVEFILMFILYYRFTPKDTLVVVALPLCFLLKIPYVVPIAVGLLCAPTSVVSVAFGTVVYYTMVYFKSNALTLTSLDSDEAITRFRYVVNGVIGNKEMMVTAVAFMAIVVVVYVIRRMSVDHAWTAAMIVGAVVGAVILLMGNLMYDVDVSLLPLIGGMVAAVLINEVLAFFFFNVDYSRTEYVQFEDDEYYYYVKAIPKNSVSTSKVTVKKMNRD